VLAHDVTTATWVVSISGDEPRDTVAAVDVDDDDSDDAVSLWQHYCYRLRRSVNQRYTQQGG